MTGLEWPRPWRLATAPPTTYRFGLVALAVGLLLAGGSSSGGAVSSPSVPQAWVANYAYQSQPGSTITPVDLRTGKAGTPVSTASEPASASTPAALAVAAGGRELLVANEGSDRLSVISTTSDTTIASVRVGLEPDAVAVAAGGPNHAGIALVANFGDDTVTPVYLGTMRAGPPIAAGSEPDAVAVAGPAGSGASTLALVANFGSDTVTPIDLTTMTAGTAIAVGSEPDAIAVPGSTTGPAFVANLGAGSLTAIDLTTLVPGQAFPVGVDPTSLAVGPAGKVVWIGGGSSIEALTVSTLALGSPIDFPNPVEAVALTGSGTTAWVALEDGAVRRVILSTATVGRAVRVGGRPSAIAIAR